jgi:hypothetical protein
LVCFPGALQSLLFSIPGNFPENRQTDNEYSVFSLFSKTYVAFLIYLLDFFLAAKFYCHAGTTCGYTGG